MKKVVVVVAVVLGLLVALGFGVDRAAASVVERTVSERVQAELGGTGSVSTQVHGVPLLTQAVRGSLDHVSVSMSDVVADGVTLEQVDVELYDVTVSSPRTAGQVEATATLGLDALAKRLGDGWALEAQQGALVVSRSSGLPVQARVTPVVRDGKVSFELDSVSVLGLEVSGDSIPAVVRDQVTALAGQVGELPFGLVPQEVRVVGDAVVVTATGTDVDLEKA